MIYDILYDNIRKRLTCLTPLPLDCGRLCGGACCEGDTDSGMYLFPFEERFYEDDDGFEIVDSELLYSDGTPVKMICCTSRCKREKRPISCMIFPLFPYIKNDSSICVITDPRANGLCPLCFPENKHYIQDSFFREVNLFAKYLIKTPKGADFLKTVSSVLDDYLKFYGKENMI